MLQILNVIPVLAKSISTLGTPLTGPILERVALGARGLSYYGSGAIYECSRCCGSGWKKPYCDGRLSELTVDIERLPNLRLVGARWDVRSGSNVYVLELLSDFEHSTSRVISEIRSSSSKGVRSIYC